MRLGIVGRGYWSGVYARTLKELRIPFWQETHYWHIRTDMDGLIVACPNEFHYQVAKCALGRKIPVLVEKPITLDPDQAYELAGMGGIAFGGYTRIYSDAWRAWEKPAHVEAFAGGVNAGNPDPLQNWLPHLIAMALDAKCSAAFHISRERHPLRFGAFEDQQDEPLKNLIREFCAAIESGRDECRLLPEVVSITRNLIAKGSDGDFHLRRVADGGNALEQQAGVPGPRA